MEETSPHIARLKTIADAFPTLPGVYLMKNQDGEVIYVGKARSLRARVRSYLCGGDGRLQIEFLVSKIHDIEKIVTQSEAQAFILERDLITKYKPRYNIRLKDDKTYLSIRVDEDAEWPRLELVRKVEDDGARYFGPYAFSYELRSLLEIIKRVVPLRTCSNTVFHNRQRPCLEYQIKRCAGPCCLPVSPDEYRSWVKQAIAILEGRSEGLVRELKAKMERAAEDLRFEDAAMLRDRIDVLEATGNARPLVSQGSDSRDVFAFYREERLAVLTVFNVRNGRIADSVNYTFSDVLVSDEEFVESGLEQYYEGGREIPEEILLPLEIENLPMIEEVLRERRGAAISFSVPQRGLLARLIGLAQLNAQQHFVSTFNAETRYMELAKELGRLLKLKQVPRRIECVDISNFQGSDIMGAVVVFFEGVPDKKSYRSYRISQQDKPDDFASIAEVVQRRLRRGMEEGDLPDLLIIDGGPGQLASAIAAREQLKLSLEIVSLAKFRSEQERRDKRVDKKPERIYLEGQSEPIPLDPQSATTHFLERIRDEVHRFVIGSHRRSRSKRVFRSVLDDIPGVGPERKRRLLRAYGSVEQMKEVPPADFAKAGRMPLSLAEKILGIIRAK